MRLFSIDEFKELAQQTANVCVSIYTPTERLSTDAYQASKIHFKNALAEARTLLIE